MSIASLLATTAAAPHSLLDLFSAPPAAVNSARTATLGAANGSRPSSGANPLLSAVTHALSQVGVPAGAASTAANASGSANAGQALQSFFQQLLAALHAQGAGATGAPIDAGAHGHYPHGGGISQAVQNLLRQLNTDPTRTSGPLGSLQQSFTGLVSSLRGASSAQPSLGGFLNAFAGHLPSGTGALLHARA